MRFLLLSTCVVVFFAPALVHASVVTSPKTQHALSVISQPQDAQEFFGSLKGFPHTYTFSLQESTAFSAEIFEYAQAAKQNDVTILLVREEDRGVAEIGRTQGKDAQWSEVHDAVLVESFNSGGTITADLDPGSYRLEVSSLNNDVTYRLILHTEAQYNYFSALTTLFEVKKLLGSPVYTILISPLVYIPLLVVLLIGAYGWRSISRKQSYI